MQNCLEKNIERKVVDWAKRNDILALKLNLLGSTGWPDRLFIGFRGSLCFIEFKREGEKPRPLQEVRLQWLIQRGFCVHVCDSVDSAIAALEATLVSKNGDKVNDQSWGSRVIARSRTW